MEEEGEGEYGEEKHNEEGVINGDQEKTEEGEK